MDEAYPADIECSNLLIEIESMIEIQERELRDYLTSKAVQSIRVQRTEEGYRVFTQLTWRDEEVVLVRQRGGIRYYKSFDKLISMLDKYAPQSKPPIMLLLGQRL